MYLADCHLHTHHSPDSESGLRDVCEAGLRAGLSALTVTDHVEMSWFVGGGYDRSSAASFEETSRFAAEYRERLLILRGVELGEPLEDQEAAEALLNSHDYDFVLGSLHHLPGVDDFYFLDYGKVDPLPLLDRYFDELLRMVGWGRFDSLAHLTYPFRYLPEDLRSAGTGRWRDGIDAVLKAAAGKGLALEINVSGLRDPRYFLSPDLPLLRRFHELGGRLITVGSDAHRPQDVGVPVEEGLRAAKEAGFDAYALFVGRQPVLHPLDL